MLICCTLTDHAANAQCEQHRDAMTDLLSMALKVTNCNTPAVLMELPGLLCCVLWLCGMMVLQQQDLGLLQARKARCVTSVCDERA